MIRLKADTLAMIDAARGEASRADYIEQVICDKSVDAQAA